MTEPTVDDSVQILLGLKPYFEEHHSVKYIDDAVRSAVELSARYINDRHLPDKAIDVIDETGSRVHLARLSPPEEIGKLETETEPVC